MMKIVLKGCGCSPTAYSGGSTALVHATRCRKYPEAGLTEDEYKEWRAQAKAIATLHPVLARRPAIEKIVPFPIPKEYWHTCGPSDGCDATLRGDGIPFAKHKSAPPKAGI
jgi:hypothetical protein